MYVFFFPTIIAVFLEEDKNEKKQKILESIGHFRDCSKGLN